MTSPINDATSYAKTPTTPLGEGEEVLTAITPDRATYIRDHAWMAAIAMAVGMAGLWAWGNPHWWTGGVGGLAAIVVRGWYVASDELAVRWDLTDRRLLGPGPRRAGLREITRINTLFSAVQVITAAGDKHLIKYQPDAGATKALIERVQAGGRP